jgi:phosphoenolpyruvate---glycerone phosphotransferase subunit DhaL
MDADRARAWITGFAAAVNAHKDELTRLDQAIGDGDHGSNLDRGLTKAVADLDGETAAEVLKKVGRTLISTVGGASGPLYGTVFREAAKALQDDPDDLATALRKGLEGVQKLGGAAEGDKTMVDALIPAVAALETGGDAAAAARLGAEATIPLQARKGRASYLGARSVGHQDPGATSTALLFQALADA